MKRDEMNNVVEILSQILKPPYQIVQHELDNRWSFAITHEPSEHVSDEEPPIRFEAGAEVIPIDRFLGQYEPRTQRITIFRRGIDRAAKTLKAHGEELAFIVRLHEWAHALLHIGLQEGDRLAVTSDQSLWPAILARVSHEFQSFDAALQERLPQLLTYHGLCSLNAETSRPEARAALDRMARTFEQLSLRQPAEYQIQKYTKVPKTRLVESIGLLKTGALVGAEAWHTVVTW